MEIMRLRDELSRRDMQIALMENTTGIPPEVWVEVLKAAVPVVGDLVQTAKVAVTAWGSSLSSPGAVESAAQSAVEAPASAGS
jgi:hypothetical protein